MALGSRPKKVGNYNLFRFYLVSHEWNVGLDVSDARVDRRGDVVDQRSDRRSNFISENSNFFSENREVGVRPLDRVLCQVQGEGVGVDGVVEQADVLEESTGVRR